MKGRIHSIETCGAVDGPGLRYIVFTQGCPLRCQYCHNPDTWKATDGNETTTEELIEDIVKYKSFMNASNGGVTVSGGEPFLQPEFLKDLLMKCKENGLHTAVDSSGYVNLNIADPILDYTDLVLLDIKSYNKDVFKSLTGVELDRTIAFAKHLEQRGIPIWLRYVFVPNLTDNHEDIEHLAQFLSTLTNLQRIDILPFHKMGEYKWEQLGYDYKLADTKEPTVDETNAAADIFRKYNLPIIG
ncbi:MAG: pyruvate formate-lyase-activating protein [Cellulosilyticum sp.]|nr:pyruvate formate lyase-activating protein [Cellulosilyticum sp.]MEE1073449.1 pyruvate formate-lyase-activating protein [Cellulosilyticum sp.]